jgi:hypothetical protein
MQYSIQGIASIPRGEHISRGLWLAIQSMDRIVDCGIPMKLAFQEKSISLPVLGLPLRGLMREFLLCLAHVPVLHHQYERMAFLSNPKTVVSKVKRRLDDIYKFLSKPTK